MSNQLLRLIIIVLFPYVNYAQVSQSGRGSVPLGNNIYKTEGNTYAIIVGVSDYKYLPKLNYAHRDALAFRDYLLHKAIDKVDSSNVFTFIDVEATKNNIWLKGFENEKLKKIKPGDKLYIYFAGHGDAKNAELYYFLGYDCVAPDVALYEVSSAINMATVKSIISELVNEKKIDVFLIIDACRGGDIPGGKIGVSQFMESVMSRKCGEISMLSCGPNQKSFEHNSLDGGHGLFTHYLLEGLNGEATNNKEITLNDLEDYVKSKVKKNSDWFFNTKQIPEFCCSEKYFTVLNLINDKDLSIKSDNNKRVNDDFITKPNVVNSFGSKHKLKIDTLIPIKVDTVRFNKLFDKFNESLKHKNEEGIDKSKSILMELKKICKDCEQVETATNLLSLTYLNICQGLIHNFIQKANYIRFEDLAYRKTLLNIENNEFQPFILEMYVQHLHEILISKTSFNKEYEMQIEFLLVYLDFMNSFNENISNFNSAFGLSLDRTPPLIKRVVNLHNKYPNPLNYYLSACIHNYFSSSKVNDNRYNEIVNQNIVDVHRLAPKWMEENKTTLMLSVQGPYLYGGEVKFLSKKGNKLCLNYEDLVKDSLISNLQLYIEGNKMIDTFLYENIADILLPMDIKLKCVATKINVDVAKNKELKKIQKFYKSKYLLAGDVFCKIYYTSENMFVYEARISLKVYDLENGKIKMDYNNQIYRSNSDKSKSLEFTLSEVGFDIAKEIKNNICR
jgi:hypothetical protein